MAFGNLLTDELALPEGSQSGGHPMDSARILRGLMALSRQAEAAEADQQSSGMIEGVISKGVLRSLLSALHFRDVATVRHSRRVAKIATGLAHFLRWEPRQIKPLEVAGLLHDIGKIGVPDSILFKPGLLSPDEAGLMALHYNIGIDVLQACRVDKEVIEIIDQSHSEYDVLSSGIHGSGGSSHQGARILAVADAYDSLATDHVYRDAKPHAEIMKVLTEASGTQFDGNVVSALQRWVETEGPLPTPANEPDGDASVNQLRPEDALEAGTLCHIFSYLYLLESLYDGFYLLDSDLRFVVWSRGMVKLLGIPAPKMLGRMWSSQLLNYQVANEKGPAEDGRHIHRIIEAGKNSTGQYQMRRTDGSAVSIEVQSVPLLDESGQLQGVAEILRDMSRQSRGADQKELKLAASRDSLTNVANRGTLETQLANMVIEFNSQTDSEPFSVIFLDIDHFKPINDTHGHVVGDEVLVSIAKLLQQETYSGETVGRYGGEEFVILCPGTTVEHAVRRADRLRLAICGAEMAGLADEQVTASFGVAEVEPGDSVESILRRADRALYLSKERGRNQVNSLSSEELRDGLLDEENDEGGGLKFVTTFQACIAADMIVYKLGGFVDEQHAKLIDVEPQRATMRLGTRGLLPKWGSDDSRRPVLVELEFGKSTSERRGRKSKGGSSRVDVKVRITPVGWVRDRVAFDTRCKRVLNALREYFLAD